MRYFVEFLAVSLVMVLLMRTEHFKFWLRRHTSSIRLLMIGILLIMLAGQFARSPSLTFPFVQWDMYTEPNYDDHIYHVEVRAVNEKGDDISINPSRLYPSLGMGTFRVHNLLYNIGRDALRGGIKEPAGVEDLLQSICVEYERRHPNQNLVEASLLWVSEEIGREDRDETLLLSVDLEGVE